MHPDFLAPLATATVGLLHLLMACAAWLMLRGPRHAGTVRLWAAGTLGLGISLALGGLAHPLPPHLPALVQRGLLPALVLASLLLQLLALRRHMGLPLHLGAAAALASLTALGWLASLQSGDARVPASYANAVLLLATAVIGQHAWEGSRGSGATARWVAWSQWLLTAAVALRAIAIAAAAPVAGRWDWWLVLGAAAVAALFGNLGFLGMVLDELHRTELQARQARIDETASRAAAEQTAQELQDLLAQRDALAEERERLLQMLAHEIRQPLQAAGLAMQGAVQVLRDPRGAAADQVGSQLLQALTVLGDVRSVLDNTLATATLLSRNAPLVRQDVALDFLVNLTLGDLGARQLQRLHVDWRTAIDSLEVEPGLVRLALRNLLSNAFVHGGPQVQVQLTIDAAPQGRGLRLTVSDDGPGMLPAQLQDPPLQPGQPARRRLGLSIVRQVMDLHGGELVLANALPHGFVAQLVFALPADDWGMDDALAAALVGAAGDADQAGTSGARNT